MGVFVALIMSISFSASAETVCAERYSDLDLTPRLASLKPLFTADKLISVVNETKGSYVIINGFENQFSISFFTSGIFDLYPIRKDGPLAFCDDGVNIVMNGLGRTDTMKIVDGGFQMGKGGPKQSFANGEMPALLKKLHKVDIRGIATESPRPKND